MEVMWEDLGSTQGGVTKADEGSVVVPLLAKGLYTIVDGGGDAEFDNGPALRPLPANGLRSGRMMPSLSTSN